MSCAEPRTYQHYLSGFPIPDPDLLVQYQEGDMVLNYINLHT